MYFLYHLYKQWRFCVAAKVMEIVHWYEATEILHKKWSNIESMFQQTKNRDSMYTSGTFQEYWYQCGDCILLTYLMALVGWYVGKWTIRRSWQEKATWGCKLRWGLTSIGEVLSWTGVLWGCWGGCFSLLFLPLGTRGQTHLEGLYVLSLGAEGGKPSLLDGLEVMALAMVVGNYTVM